MSGDGAVRLLHAVAAVRYGGGAAAMSARVRRDGLHAFDAVLAGLSADQAREVHDLAEELAGAGGGALLLGEAGYPASLAGVRGAPAALFFTGARSVLDRPSVGICGSRNASPNGLRAARLCSEALAARGIGVVSGYARGVDTAAHAGALAAGGDTVVVLPEGIGRFRLRGGELTRLWDDRRVVVLSQFPPNQPWTAGSAMARNAVVSGLGRALVVVEAGDTGGTLAAGLHALERGRPVFVLEAAGTEAPGNRRLRERGAVVVRDHEELEHSLEASSAPGPTQLSLI